MLRDAAAGVADDPGAVRVVHDERRVVLPHELDDLRQLREVALHREDAVGDHERALPRFQRGELLAQGVHVGVLVDRLARGLREPDRVDDRRVVQLVGEDHRVLVGQARDRGLVRVPARHVGERGLGADELGELALELEVRLERAADEAHGRRARAVLAEPLDPGLDHLRPVGEPEVVVRGEHEHLAAALHLDERPLRRAERVEALVGARLAQRVELGAQPRVHASDVICAATAPRAGRARAPARSAAATARARPGRRRSCRPPPPRAARTPPRTPRAAAPS